MDEVIETWEKLGYTNVSLCERNFFHMEEHSPLYQKLEGIYGCQTENIVLIIFDGYGDDKHGNRKDITYICDSDHFFFAGNEEEYKRVIENK